MTNDEYQTLVAWIAEQPPGQTAEALHEAFHTPSVAARQLAPRWRVKEELYCAGQWPALLVAQTHEDPAIAGLAATAVAFLTDGDFENINLDRLEVAGMLDALQAAGLLTSELRATIDALADAIITPAQSLGIAPRLIDFIRAQREVQS